MKKDNNKKEKKETKKDWTKLLPRGTAGRIHAIIMGTENSIDISAKTVQRILKGESEDSYGVLTMAVEMYKEQDKSNQKLLREYSILKLKQAQPLRSKI